MGQPLLVDGLELTGLPDRLSDTVAVVPASTPDLSSYYTVASGEDWGVVADKLYGDATLAESLQDAMGGVSLMAGTVLGPLPESLSHTVTKTYVSDLPLNVVSNGWGPVERDTSVGEYLANDGGVLSLDGRHYEKGLGTHSDADIRIDLTAGNYSRFQSYVGIDDSRRGTNQVRFLVYGDSALLFDSGAVSGVDTAQFIDVSVEDVSELRLVVENVDGYAHDHANWADTVLLSQAQAGAGAAGAPLISTHVETRDANISSDTQYRYTVPAGATWSSIAQALYGDESLADALERALDSPVLSEGVTLAPLPTRLASTEAKAYLSDLPLNVVSNGWGPVERDSSVGEYLANDGGVLSLDGQQYEKGLGTHSDADIRVDLTVGQYTRFQSYVGIDDSRSGTHQVRFLVYGDSALLFDSGAVRGIDAAQFIDVSVEGVGELRLVVENVDGYAHDHANWAGAALLLSADSEQAGVALQTANAESHQVETPVNPEYVYIVQ